MTDVHRSGFAALVGRPNVGKSTLTNALVGEKVAITSDKPQTTRRAIRGILTTEDAQIILVDTPGVHRPRTLLGRRLNDLVNETLTDVDVVGFCIPADQKIGPGDRYIAQALAEIRANRSRPVIVVIVTKADLVSRDQLADQLVAVSQFIDADEIVPISAVEGTQIDVVIRVIASHLPEGPALYPDGVLTEESIEDRIAELVREAALADVRDELPHSLAAVVEEIVEEDPEGDPFKEMAPGEGRLVVRVSLFVERDSQKGIVIGKGGAHLKKVGTTARRQIRKLMGRPVHLDIRVKVAKDWQRDPKQLGRLGF
ncbi:GTPase Era [Helcobacillus massiliensis]|uniref:GTPase Era n=1 Tax=Helcobacillus massiliensis TaxID=521392 RepID=UPI0021A7C466|nr:GTPase Era [Helcobacillus massiliensis]MCT1557159.1 GTPase Era [Helcobacillus massiliensis]MCT2036106.1 GTPase Era [Helcobacillus massiliensis]MCT2331237.1 GTPase Era [Helcobacillus massiliensis]